MPQIELTDWEFRYLQRKVGSDFVTYVGHANGAGLFEKEQQDMDRLRELNKKFDTPANGS